MKRYILLLALISGLLLSACGGAAPSAPQASTDATQPAGQAAAPTAAPAAPSGDDSTAVALQATEQAGIVSQPQEGKQNVTWWTHNNPAFVAANKEMIKRFEAENPDIHIVYQFFPYDIFINKLQTAYASGTEFLRHVTDSSSDCVVLDMHMPRLTGLDVQVALRERHLSLPVVILTGNETSEMRAAAFAAGVDDYLAKPVDDDVLIGSIVAAMHQHNRPRESGATKAPGAPKEKR